MLLTSSLATVLQAGQHVILWHRASMVRVDEGKDEHQPDYEWLCKGADGGVELLDKVWGAGRWSRTKKPYNEELKLIGVERRLEPGKEVEFFRYPPITVVLRRVHTSTLYVVTTHHTPGSGTGNYLKQLAREVRWLMHKDKYRMVMEQLHPLLVKGRGEGQGNAKDKLLDLSSTIHVVAGDFNTQLYPKVAAAEKAAVLKKAVAVKAAKEALEAWNAASQDVELSEPQLKAIRKQARLEAGNPFECLDNWVAHQGNRDTEATTAHKHPDVVYVLRSKATKALGLKRNGFLVPSMVG